MSEQPTPETSGSAAPGGPQPGGPTPGAATAGAPSAVRDPVWDVARIVVTVLTIAVAAWALVQGLEFRPLAAYFPVAAAGMVVLFGSIQLLLDLRNLLRGKAVVVQGLDVESPIHGLGLRGLLPALRYMAWFVGFVLLYHVVGIFVSGFVFIAAFLRLEARWTWAGTVIAALAVVAASGLMIWGLGLRLPSTLLDLGHELVT